MIQRLERLPGHLPPSSIERVDLDGEGRRVLTVRDEATLRWWVETPDGWAPIGPEDDRELPLARELEASAVRMSGPDAERGRDPAAPAARAACAAHVVAWKPGRRMVVLAPGGDPTLVLKGYRRHAAERAAETHAAAERALAGTPWRAASLCGTRRELAALEFVRADGGPLALDEQATDVHFRLGAGLRALQESRVGLDLRAHRARDELDVVATLRRRAEGVLASVPAEFDEVAQRLRESLDGLRESAPAPCHRDLHDGQFLQTRERITCLDFDLLCCADTALDGANFVAHLQLRALQGERGATPAGALALARAFLEGLDREQERGFSARLCWYQAATYLRLSAVHAMRPRHAHLAPELARLARRCLEDLERA